MDSSHGQRWTAPVEGRWVGDAVDLQLRNLREAGDEALHQFVFVAMDGFESRDNAGATGVWVCGGGPRFARRAAQASVPTCFAPRMAVPLDSRCSAGVAAEVG